MESHPLDNAAAIALVSRLKVYPNFRTDPEALAVVVEWFKDHCRGFDQYTPYEHAELLVKQIIGMGAWNGPQTLSAANDALHTAVQGQYTCPFSPADYEPPKCPQCGDNGYYRPPEGEYVLCPRGAMPETAAFFVAFENDKLKKRGPQRSDRLRSYARTKQTLNYIDKPEKESA